MIYIYYKFTDPNITYKEQHGIGCSIRDKMIKEIAGISKEFIFSKDENSKPYIRDSDILYNISHTAGCVACAMYIPEESFDKKENHITLLKDEGMISLEINNIKNIGCDVEALSREKKSDNIYSIAERFFSECEQNYISDSENTSRAFYEIWTRKESYLKCTGEGLKGMKKTDTFNLPNAVKIYPYIIRNGKLCYSLSVCTEA